MGRRSVRDLANAPRTDRHHAPAADLRANDAVIHQYLGV